MKNKPIKVTKATLKERGWTDSLIRRFLPEPDATAPNPRYPNAGAPMQLYSLNRAKRIEASKKFQAAMKESEARKLSARKAVETKAGKTVDWASTLPDPSLPPLTISELRTKAMEHYNSFGGGSPNYRGYKETRTANYGGSTEPDDFLDRISVNYVRHKLTPYEKSLLRARGRVGVVEAKNTIRSKVLKAIATAYPWLADECESQDVPRFPDEA